MKRVLNIYHFQFGDSCLESNKGVSQTVPNEATSLKDLVRRAAINATLPEIAKQLEYGEDESFEDAFENDQDLADYIDNLDYIEKLSAKIRKVKSEYEKKKASKAEKKPNDGTSQSKVDNVPGEA